jgi:transcriptional regulator of met regulon
MFGGNSRSGGKLQAMLCENFPGKFRRRQVVVLRHALSGQELSEILFAVHDALPCPSQTVLVKACACQLVLHMLKQKAEARPGE